MMKYFRLLNLFFKQSLMYSLTYRTDFVIWALVSFGWVITTIIFFESLYGSTQIIAGWTKPMMYVFQGIFFIINFFIWGLLWENMEKFPQKANTGELDLYLIKPVNTQFMLSFKQIDLSNLADLTAGILLLAHGLKLGQFTLSIAQVFGLLFFLTLSVTYLYSVWFITTTCCLFATRLDNIPYLFPSLRNIWRVPHSFFEGALRLVFTYVLPITLAVTIPAEIALGQYNGRLAFILGIFALFMLLVCHYFLRFALRFYTSASS